MRYQLVATIRWKNIIWWISGLHIFNCYNLLAFKVSLLLSFVYLKSIALSIASWGHHHTASLRLDPILSYSCFLHLWQDGMFLPARSIHLSIFNSMHKGARRLLCFLSVIFSLKNWNLFLVYRSLFIFFLQCAFSFVHTYLLPFESGHIDSIETD